MRARIFLIIWSIIILILTLLPGNIIPHSDFSGKMHIDKVVHFTIFLVFAILFYLSVPSGTPNKNINLKGIIIILVISLAYVTLIEILQRYIPGRDFEPEDVIAGGAGTLTGLLFMIIRKNIVNK